MPYGLSNAPNTFIQLMNDVFKPFNGKFMVVHFDNIIVYSRDKEQYLMHLRQVFQVLKEEKLSGT